MRIATVEQATIKMKGRIGSVIIPFGNGKPPFVNGNKAKNLLNRFENYRPDKPAARYHFGLHHQGCLTLTLCHRAKYRRGQ